MQSPPETRQQRHRLPFLPELEEQKRLQLQWQTAQQLGLPVGFSDRLKTGADGPEMMVIPAGTFEMGSPDTEFGHRSDESPQHYAQLTRPFALSRYTVTAQQFAHYEQAVDWHWRSDLVTAHGLYPVMNIRIAEAEDYCRWLSAETGQHYRLPTETEWEYACRAGSSRAFHFGDSVSCREVHFNASLPYEEARQNRRWYLPRCSPLAQSLPVGSKPANLWGLHEMHGNVWEFTASIWTENHGQTSHERIDATDLKQRMVVKGGSWFDAAVHARSASRRPRLRDELDVNLGIRLLREC